MSGVVAIPAAAPEVESASSASFAGLSLFLRKMGGMVMGYTAGQTTAAIANGASWAGIIPAGWRPVVAARCMMCWNGQAWLLTVNPDGSVAANYVAATIASGQYIGGGGCWIAA
jgi:hypothetical protein